MKRASYLQLLLTPIIILLASTLLLSVYWLNQNIQEYKKRFDEKVRYSNALLSLSSEDFLWVIDNQALEQRVRDFIEADNEIIKITVTSPTIDNDVIEISSKNTPSKVTEKHHIELFKKQVSLGSLEVTYTRDLLNAHIKKTKIFVVVTILIYFLLNALLSIYWKNEQRLLKFKENRYRSIFNNVHSPIIEFSITHKNFNQLSHLIKNEKSISKNQVAAYFLTSKMNSASHEFLNEEIFPSFDLLEVLPDKNFFEIINSIINKKDIETQNLQFLNHLGEKKSVAINGAAYPNFDNSGLSILLSINDLSELHQSIESEKLLTKQMHTMQRMQSIGTLVGGIAHDFNNILLAISGYSELLKNKASKQELDYLTGIDSAVVNARALTSQMMNYSYAKSSEDTRMNLNEAVKATESIIFTGIPVRISITYEVCDTQLQILSIPAKILQIIMNLTTNAHHAISRNTGGTINVSLEEKEITKEQALLYKVPQGKKFACISVKDNGSGIAQEHLDNVFDPFFTTKETDKGTGLGLYVVFGLVQNMKGFIQVDSKLNIGTAIHIYLPLLSAPEKLES